MNPERLVVVAGLSGSGKSTVLNRLEDLGYQVVHNLPVPLVEGWLSWARKSSPTGAKAIGLDSTGIQDLESIDWLHKGDQAGHFDLVFLTANDAELLRRYSVTRRRHPGSDEEKTLKEALEVESGRLEPFKEVASYCLDTTRMTASQLKEWVAQIFGQESESGLRLTLVSFGFKYGIPTYLDVCADLRFLLNPYYDLNLRHLTGHDDSVYNYVMNLTDAQRWLSEFTESLIWQHKSFEERGKTHLCVGLGCTGGQHRSVTLARALAAALRDRGVNVDLRHRETPAPKLL
ncbi:MAG: RNase adapter RapZ [Myxococcales bacterium]|nr:RNase adapter RapZ [Myxococcales bacterium]